MTTTATKKKSTLSSTQQLTSKRKRKRKITTTKKKKTKPLSTLHSTPKTVSLPDDLLLTIIARVPRLYYPILSLVSKSFRSLVASPQLYKVRSLLGHTESCLYVCLCLGSSYSWFTLYRKPDQTKKNSSGYVLVRVPMHDAPCVDFQDLVAVGSDIYNIGVSHTSRVWILDCRSHTWREAPSMPVELDSLSASVVDKKIYVDSWKKSIKVLDTKTQIWDVMPIPYESILYRPKSTCINGKFHVVTSSGKVIALNSMEGRWDVVDPKMACFQSSDSYCEIDNVVYVISLLGCLKWYDTKGKERSWRVLKGLVGIPKFSSNYGDGLAGYSVRLLGYGGKLIVLWTYVNAKKIWCAEIALERRESCEIWGKVEWCDCVLSIPRAFKFVEVLAATL